MHSVLLLLIGLQHLLLSNNVQAENILAIFPSDYRSHFTFGKVLFNELANRGHTVRT